MQFPKNYFEGEEREGFYIEPMMKRYWAAQIEVLSIINTICEKYNIKYFAYWGTLLGAVRHKGFIPWDDDLDIAMVREDFDRFFEVAKKELPSEYKLISLYDATDWEIGIGRVTNDTKIIINREKLNQFHGCPFAVGIDIFPYDHVPDDETIRKNQQDILDLIKTVTTAVAGSIAECEKNGMPIVYVEEIHTGLDYIENMFGFQFNREIHLLNQLNCLYDQIYASYGKKTDKYLTSYIEKEKRENDYKIPAFWVNEVVSLPFENTYIKVPKYYEACLSVCYGPGYMTPIKMSAGHDYPAYNKQIGFMEEQNLCGLYEMIMQTFDDNYSDEEPLHPVDKFLIKKSDLENSGKSQKRVLYCVGISDIFNKEEEYVNKVIDTFEFIKKGKDVRFLFTYDPLIFDMINFKNSSLSNRLKKSINEFISGNYADYYEYKDVDKAIAISDAYYGTNGENVKKMQVSKKPVMIQNTSIKNN